MTTDVDRELAKDAVCDLADVYGCRIEFHSLVADSYQAVCRASRDTYWKLVNAIIEIGLETSLQHVERRDVDLLQWDLIVRVPDAWAPDRTGATAGQAPR